MTNLEAGWSQQLSAEFDKPYMQDLRAFLKSRKQAGAEVYPPTEECFSAFNSTPFEQVKVVVLGQDPYHGTGQAHGLSFSVKPGVAVPPSLKNIYKELESDLHIQPVDHGFLEAWAKQGVLLLNSVLTVEKGQAGAHQRQGWEQFTDKAVEALSEERTGLVFLLWGSHAQKKGKRVDRNKHLVLETTHPSPLSAYRGFLGCRHFSVLNQYLIEQGKSPINWQLPERP
jgi:uracil-DNA glycosylase